MKATKFAFFSTCILFVFGLMLLSSDETDASSSDLSSIVSLKHVVGGFTQPTAVTSTGMPTDGRLFVIEKTGKIKIIKDGVINADPFLNLEGSVSTESERGLLGLAFDPNYSVNGYFYLNYSDNRPDTKGDTIIKRYKVSADPDIADDESGETILEIEQDFDNHNGGWLAFDKDGQLVIGMGDGGSGGDPNDRAQSRDSLLGKMLRINVHDSGLPATSGCGRVRNYLIPEDNPRPFGSGGWCSEIWSYGWRNPWRFSFDSSTGDMWAGDVGQGDFEELNFEAANADSLLNYGWRCREGNSLYSPGGCTLESSERVDPVIDYDRDTGRSITGGYVYRGSSFLDMQGKYFYGDFSTGRLWSIDKDNAFAVTEHDDTSHRISSFGEGSDDELYLVDYRGSIYQVVTQFGAKVELTATPLAEVDGLIEYKITVTNMGTDDLTVAKVINTVPAGVTYVSGGSESGGIVTLDIGDANSGFPKSVSWFGRPNVASTITNTVFELDAQELSSPIPGRQGENQTTLVVEELFRLYLPVAIR